ncbi:MAG: hypothetical protein FWF73_04640 [Spirochaetes bacterium]|nr:hypothetical protein [Spirochaetota bacterium]
MVEGGDDGGTPIPDPITSWTAVSDSTFGTTEICGIAYGGGKFVAVSFKGEMAYSVTTP